MAPRRLARPRARSRCPRRTTRGGRGPGHWPWHGGPVELDDHVARAPPRRPWRRGRAGRRRRSRRRCRCRRSASRRRRSPTRRAVAPLGEHRAVRVVVDGDRACRAAPPSAPGTARPRAAGAGRRATSPRAGRSRAGMPKPAPSTGAGAASAASRTIAASVSSSSRRLEPLRAALRAVMDARGRRRRRPASSFVPPTSTPMTHAAGHPRHHSREMAADPPPPEPGGRPPYRVYRTPFRAGSSRGAPVVRASCAPPHAARPASAAGRRRRVRPRRPPWRRDPQVDRASRSPAGSRCPSSSSCSRAQFLQDRVDSETKSRARRRRPAGRLARDGADPRLRPALQVDRRSPARSTSGPSRSDSIQLMRVGGGHSAKLSIPRDTIVEHPRPRAEQDQRRLRDRRVGARGADRQAVPRDRDQPRRRSWTSRGSRS